MINRIIKGTRVFCAFFVSLFFLAGVQSPLTASSGAFTRKIPIEILPGAGGAQPDISLVYNSDSSYGIAGAGWTISGLPSITAKNLGTSINFFSSNYGRLIPTSMGYRYSMENVIFLKLTSEAGKYLWEERHSDGTRIFYRETQTRVFPVEKVLDRENRGYKVKYVDHGDGQLYPGQIIYTTKNGVFNRYKQVFFEYEPRPDKRVHYLRGNKVETNYRLKSIWVETNLTCTDCTRSDRGDPVRRYDLTYGDEITPGDGGPVQMSRLVEVSMTDSTRTKSLRLEKYSYPEFKVDSNIWTNNTGPYHNTNRIFHYYGGVTTDFWGNDTYHFRETIRGAFFDINGDGRKDKIISVKTYDGYYNSAVYLNKATGWQSDNSYKLPVSLMDYSKSAPFAGGMMVDLNGDGLLDVVQSLKTSGGEWNRTWLNKNTPQGDGKVWQAGSFSEPPEIMCDYSAGYDQGIIRGAYVDLNGDGYVDWVRSFRNTSGAFAPRSYLNDKNGGWNMTDRTFDPPVPLRDYQMGELGTPAEVSQFIDLNGDGLIDLVSAYTKSDGTFVSDAWLNNGSGFTQRSSYAPLGSMVTYVRGYDAPKKRGVFIDLNGDGLVDQLISIRGSDASVAQNAYLNTGSGWVKNNNFNTPDYLFDYGLLTSNLRSTCSVLFNEEEFSSVESCENYYHVNSAKFVRSRGALADVNGDGLIDWVRSYQVGYDTTPVRAVYINHGNTFDNQKAFREASSYHNVRGANVTFLVASGTTGIAKNNLFYHQAKRALFVDLDADGADDWVASYTSQFNNPVDKTCLSKITSTGTTHPHKISRVDNKMGGHTDITYKPALDFSGYIKPVFGSSLSVPDVRTRLLLSDTTFHDGVGTTGFQTTYNYIDARVYTGDYDKRRVIGPKTVEITDVPTGDFTITDYHHGIGSSELHIAGRVEAIYKKEKDRVVHRYSYYDKIPYLSESGTAIGTTLVRPREGVAFEELAYDLDSYNLATKTGTLIGKKKTTLTYKGPNHFDSVLVADKTVDVYNPVSDQVQHTFQTVKTYKVPAAGTYLLPDVRSSEERFDGIKQSYVIYNFTTYGRIRDRQDWHSESAESLLTAFEYDDAGNVTRVTLDNGSVTDTVYDTDYKTYPVDTSNGVFHSLKTYHNIFGTVTSESEKVDGVSAALLKTIEYDNYGREVAVKDPGGTVLSTKSYNDGALGTIGSQRNSSSELRHKDAGGALHYVNTDEYFDGTGRVTKKVSTAYTRNLATYDYYTFWEYNDKGQLSRESKPYLSSSNIESSNGNLRWTSYTYDAHNRVNSITVPAPPESGASDVTTNLSSGAISMGGSRVTYESVTDANSRLSSVKYYNILGDLVQEVKEGTGGDGDIVVNYAKTVNANGRTILTVTDPDLSTSSVTLDNFGRKIQRVDSGGGVWGYTYDTAGNLVEKTDPKGNTVTLAYDLQNRLTSKSTGTRTVAYNYNDESADYMGRLASVSDPTGTTNYTYDSQGRTTKVVRNIVADPVTSDPLITNTPTNKKFSSVDFTVTFEMSYDVAGNLINTTYPDGSVTENIYSDEGALHEVRMHKDGVDSILVSYMGPDDIDAQGATPYLTRTTGNDMQTRIYFDRASLMTTRLVTTRIGDPTTYQDLSYSYDKVGNITQIADAVAAGTAQKNASETYTYDSFNRLVSAQSDLYGSLSYVYSSGGNLEVNGTTALDYDYSIYSGGDCSPSKQTVCSDSNGNSYEYDANGNIRLRGVDAANYGAYTYDEENRLLQVHGKVTDGNGARIYDNYFGYDPDGQRTIKVSADGAVTYYINGLYEVLFTPDGGERHTRYIYGAEGDLVAQLSDSTMSVTTLTGISNMAMLDSFDFPDAQALADSLLAVSSHHWQNLMGKNTPLLLWLFAFFVFGLVAVYLKNNYAVVFQAVRASRAGALPEVSYTNPRRKGMAEISAILLVSFSSLFVFNCFNAPALEGPNLPFDQLDAPLIDNSLGMYNTDAKNARPTQGVVYFHPNHLGSTAMVTEDVPLFINGELQDPVVSRVYYKPYGEVIRGADASGGPDFFRSKFTGQEDDPETSLMYYGARYYDPAIGRFITPDTMVDEGAGIGALNRYMYVGGNPVMGKDPSGNFVNWLVMGIVAVIGAYAGGAIVNQSTDVAQWDFNNPNTWYGMGAGLMVGAFVGATPFMLPGAAGLITNPVAFNIVVEALTYANMAMVNYTISEGKGATAGGLFQSGIEGLGSRTLSEEALGKATPGPIVENILKEDPLASEFYDVRDSLQQFSKSLLSKPLPSKTPLAIFSDMDIAKESFTNIMSVAAGSLDSFRQQSESTGFIRPGAQNLAEQVLNRFDVTNTRASTGLVSSNVSY